MIACSCVASVVASGAVNASTQPGQRARWIASVASLSVCQLTAG